MNDVTATTTRVSGPPYQNGRQGRCVFANCIIASDVLDPDGDGLSPLVALIQGDSPGLGAYAEAKLQSLAIVAPVISRDAGTGKFTLTTGLVQSPDAGVTPFVPLINFTPTFDNLTGEVLLEFDPPSPDAHFFQVFGEVPSP